MSMRATGADRAKEQCPDRAQVWSPTSKRWMDNHSAMAHNRLEYRHALRGIAYLRILAGERSPSTPIRSGRWGNREIPDYPPVAEDDLELLMTRIEDLVR